ncbi:tRNA 2-selenouridine(34) synthase MnmH [cyanobacterium endosymbiont of Epithemia clementina EcSB]|uniref:tRNA 2-selenouridine(34) synthase MnmH n=1 Tax=cyanobacterium endosymbiont of Epithemia clementina EcSB TaxID=3034674 RepID=UPI0024819209|nr:tRNA 2-selenouridine(34) synthase MnmH [cyanobacterium endosymbiont of Epithemia clementina EcSB]WGT68126.1 tRNA 2-selenouridine(34) synthase MnmH [cyanobacterium endosymbiont of Epithemia clementina EcSB]
MVKSPYFIDQISEKNDCSEIIDVRSENEFVEDHIPGAINLPVLNNQERAKVGTIYKEISPFKARKIGASLVTKNISHFLEKYFFTKDKNYVPLIYCWRGGQRSNSLAIVLSQIGWQVQVLKGGYKTYRQHVRQELEILPLKFNYNILCGLTGTGKTDLLHQLSKQGYQVLDLEKIANHRGSLLGKEWEKKIDYQPSQKYFDSLLLQQFKSFDLTKPIWVESESYKIGEVYLPSKLWHKMKESPCFEVQLPLSERVNFLLKKYTYLITYPSILKKRLTYLKSRYGKGKIDDWFKLIDQKKWFDLVQDLLITHYDPAYHKSLSKTYNRFKKIIYFSEFNSVKIEKVLED